MSFRTSSMLITIAVALANVVSAGAGTVDINYGRVADNLPPASKVVKLIKSQGINKLKLYDADPAALHAFSGTDIKITIFIPNEQLSNVAHRISGAYASNNQALASGRNSSSARAIFVQHHRSSGTTPDGASDTWCIDNSKIDSTKLQACIDNSKIDSTKLQAALDYAYGEGAADCKQI